MISVCAVQNKYKIKERERSAIRVQFSTWHQDVCVCVCVCVCIGAGRLRDLSSLAAANAKLTESRGALPSPTSTRQIKQDPI